MVPICFLASIHWIYDGDNSIILPWIQPRTKIAGLPFRWWERSVMKNKYPPDTGHPLCCSRYLSTHWWVRPGPPCSEEAWSKITQCMFSIIHSSTTTTFIFLLYREGTHIIVLYERKRLLTYFCSSYSNKCPKVLWWNEGMENIIMCFWTFYAQDVLSFMIIWCLDFPWSLNTFTLLWGFLLWKRSRVWNLRIWMFHRW